MDTSQPTHTPSIILASGSPRRRQLLTLLGMPFELAPADIDEKAITGKTPRETAIKTAYAKANAASEGRTRGDILIAADTIVVLNGKIYGKPESEAEAVQMLTELSGNVHSVFTGMAVAEVGRNTLLDALETKVHIKSLSQHEIEEYVATGEPMDKAGGYAAQGVGGRIIQSIDGDYFNVVGLPIQLLLKMLEPILDVKEYRSRAEELVSPF